MHLIQSIHGQWRGTLYLRGMRFDCVARTREQARRRLIELTGETL